MQRKVFFYQEVMSSRLYTLRHLTQLKAIIMKRGADIGVCVIFSVWSISAGCICMKDEALCPEEKEKLTRGFEQDHTAGALLCILIHPRCSAI